MSFFTFKTLGRTLALTTVLAVFVGTAAAQKGSFTDSRDGKTYKTVTVGGKKWMAQNLNYQAGKSWCYGDDNSNCEEKYGRLYDWSTAQTVCPTGWHLSTRQEWNDLVKAAGGEAAGRTLKSTSGWSIYGTGTDDYGFSAMSAGYRRTNGSFDGAGGYGYWWAATEGGSGGAYGRSMDSDEDLVYEYGLDKGYGLSVRCVQ